MTRTIARSLAMLGLGLSLTACAGYQPLEANCFTREEVSADGGISATVSTMGAEVTTGDTGCDFVMLGADG